MTTLQVVMMEVVGANGASLSILSQSFFSTPSLDFRTIGCASATERQAKKKDVCVYGVCECISFQDCPLNIKMNL